MPRATSVKATYTCSLISARSKIRPASKVTTKTRLVILDARYFIFLHFYVHIFFLSFLILICGKPAK